MRTPILNWPGDSPEIPSTTDIDALYIDTAGTPQGDLVEVVERFTLSEDERRLDYEAVSRGQELQRRFILSYA